MEGPVWIGICHKHFVRVNNRHACYEIHCRQNIISGYIKKRATKKNRFKKTFLHTVLDENRVLMDIRIKKMDDLDIKKNKKKWNRSRKYKC